MSARQQLIRTSNGNVLSVPQVTENLYQLSVDFTGLDIDPFGVPIPDANDEGSFCGTGNGRSRNEKSRTRSANGPEHFRKHTGSQTSSRVGDIQFDGHRSRLRVDRVRYSRDGPGKRLIRKCLDTEFDFRALRHTGDVFLRNWHDQPQPGRLLD